MSEQSPPDIEAPAVGASVVRYREGWGVLAGILGLSVIPALILGYLFFPSMRSEGFYPVVAWVFFGFFALIPLFGIPVSLAMLAKPTILYIDETGIWWDASTRFAVIRWSEVRGLQGRKNVRVVPRREGEQGTILSGIEMLPQYPQFAEQRQWLRHIEYGERSNSPEWRTKGYIFDLPYMRVQRQVLTEIQDRRPDLML